MSKKYTNTNEELLEIREKDWYEDREFDNTKYGVSSERIISDECQIPSIICKAKKEKWNWLQIDLYNLKECPSDVWELVDLKYLYLDCNAGKDEYSGKVFLTIPKEIGNLVNLEVFEAYNAGIKSLPQEFSQLKNLKKLGLNDNAFKKFPEVICELEGLESLAINWDFNVLPNCICNLINLKYLYLPHANIDILPDELGALDKLEILCIWGTNIAKLPNSLKNLANIKILYLTRSLFETIIPPEILSQSPLEVINYILRYQSDNKKVKLNGSKMIIVGQGGVGKTCILDRLVNDVYDEKSSTEGIDIKPWLFSRNGVSYELSVWDFGGQEIYHSTHQFFLTSRSLYIFVWDARQEEEYGRIDYWLNTIESFANDSPIIIVINKCDSRNNIKNLDLKSLNERFPQIIDSFKVSCKENINIDILREAIEEETCKLPLMGMVWLSSWLSVRKELEELASVSNTISFSNYKNLCSKYKIFNEEAISLSKYLHDLGIILHFHADVFLREIVILNPEWGTNAVYKVLDSQDTILKDRNGILYIEDLPLIWTDELAYPAQVYPTILRLMENFQLSFEVERNKSYLITELLENDEITLDLNIENYQVLNFQYNYEFLPAGIMTRFIVKANKYLVEENEKKICWKKGAYLQHNGANAIVKLFDGIKERKIEINVYGKNIRGRKELLLIIRTYFNEIHDSILKLRCTQNIRCNCCEDCTYLHDYNYLLKLERSSINDERCRNSLQTVDVSKLLDGIESKKKRLTTESNEKIGGVLMGMGEINIKPEITVINNNSNENRNENDINNSICITIEIKNYINGLQGDLSDFKDELTSYDPSMEKEFTKINNSIEKLDKAKTQDEVVKSGALNKLKRFIDDVQDEETEIGKVVHTIKHGVSIVQGIARKYNAIAEWCGMPVVPKVFLLDL